MYFMKKMKQLLCESIRGEIILRFRREFQIVRNRLVLNLSRQEVKNKFKIDLVVELVVR